MSIKIQINAPENLAPDIRFEKEVAKFELHNSSVYVEIGGMEYYFDDSTDEMIAEMSEVCKCPGEEPGSCVGHEVEAIL